MKLIALLASIALASSPAIAAGPDHVYLYTDSGNVNYQCTAYHVYFDTEGFGSFYADRCVETSRDAIQWPVFPPSGIYVSLDFAPRKAAFPVQPRIARDCLFVAHAMTGATTSTVFDCRGQ